MTFRSCPCLDEDGCAECGFTGYQRQCDTCSDWFPCEHAPQTADHDKPWSCDGCWHACHECGEPAGWVAVVWLEDEGKPARWAKQQRLCDSCHLRLSNEDKIVPGTEHTLKDIDGERTAA